MGLFERNVRNGFDRRFDFNRDGKLNMAERAMQFDFFDNLDKKTKSNYDDEEDELDDELELAGLDRFDLELMDEDERRETLEDAGLDPDDYDF